MYDEECLCDSPSNRCMTRSVYVIPPCKRCMTKSVYLIHPPNTFLNSKSVLCRTSFKSVEPLVEQILNDVDLIVETVDLTHVEKSFNRSHKNIDLWDVYNFPALFPFPLLLFLRCAPCHIL